MTAPSETITTAPDPDAERPTIARRLRAGAMQNILLLGLIALGLIFQLATGVFLNPANIRGILLDSAVLLIVSIPAALLLISGYVDLSIGSVVGLGGITTAMLLTQGVPTVVAILVALLACAIIGLLNATLISVTKLSPLIVTLGTLSLAYGITRGVSSLPLSDFPSDFRMIGGGAVAGIHVEPHHRLGVGRPDVDPQVFGGDGDDVRRRTGRDHGEDLGEVLAPVSTLDGDDPDGDARVLPLEAVDQFLTRQRVLLCAEQCDGERVLASSWDVATGQTGP